jgi:hypothetical protein
MKVRGLDSFEALVGKRGRSSLSLLNDLGVAQPTAENIFDVDRLRRVAEIVLESQDASLRRARLTETCSRG